MIKFNSFIAILTLSSIIQNIFIKKRFFSVSELIKLSYTFERISPNKTRGNYISAGISNKTNANNEEQLVIHFIEPYSLFGSNSQQAFQSHNLAEIIEILKMYVKNEKEREQFIKLIVDKDSIDKALKDNKMKKAIQLLAKKENKIYFNPKSWELLQEANSSK